MELFWQYSLFFIQNLVIGGASLFLAAKFLNYKTDDLLRFTFIVSLFFLGLILLPQIALGIFGVLSFWSLFLLQLFVGGFVFQKYRKEFKDNFSVNVSWPKKSVLWSVVIFSLLILAILLLRFLNALHQVPVEYDNLAYHLPFAVEWMRTGDLIPHYYSAFAGPLAYYPSNFELLDLFVMLPFGNDYLVNLINFAFYPLVALAFFAVLRQFKVDDRISIGVTALFLSIPIMMRQVGVPLVDLLFTYSFLLSIYFLIDFIKEKNLQSLLPFAFSIGLFAGTKYLGLVYGVIIVGVAFIVFLSRYWCKAKTFWSYFGKVLVLMVLGGGFWYLRNLIDTGNPIFPVDLQILGMHFQGYGPISDNLYGFSILANLVDRDSFNFFLNGFTAMVGPQLYLIFAAGFASFVMIFFSKKKTTKGIFALLFLLQLIYLWLYFRAPYSYNNLIPNVRYALMYLVVGFVALALILEKLKLNKRLLQVLFFLILIWNLFSFVLFPSPEILNNDKIILDFTQPFEAWQLSGLLLLTIFISLNLFRSKKFIYFLLIFPLSFLIFYQSVTEREELRYQTYENWYGPYDLWHDVLQVSEWLDQQEVQKIAYTGFNFHYPLFGPNLSREVDYVNINDCLRCRYREYALANSSIRRDPDYNKWLDNLRKLDKKYVVVSPKITENVENHEFQWMKENEETFELVFPENLEAGSTYVYKVL